MAPFIAALVKFGLPILAGAVEAKGKDFIQEKLGVNLDDLLGSEAGRLQLRQLEIQHEEWLVDASIKIRAQELEFFREQEGNISERWKADMASDSWLSKNIRPSVLLFLLTAYTLFSILSGFKFEIEKAYIELLGQWGIIVMTAYFGGRTLEKITLIKKGGGQ